MIHTDIVGNTLVAYGDLNTSINGEVVVEIANPSWNTKTTQSFLEDRQKDRQLTGYTIQEQIMLLQGNYIPKQW